MFDGKKLQKTSFNLDEDKPIKAFIRTNDAIRDNYFDMHYAFEIGVLVKGRMRRRYLDYQMETGPSDVWFCGMWEPHGFELLERPCEAIIFVISPKYLVKNPFLKYNEVLPFQVHPRLRPKTDEKSKAALKNFIQRTIMSIDGNEHPDWVKIHLYELLLLLLEGWKAPEHKTDYELPESINNALRLVFKKKELIPTSEAAAACNMSTTKFRTVFKGLMRSSFSDFALNYRINSAVAQMKSSAETQEAIAQYWGFTDASHLHKYIKRLDSSVLK